MWFLGSCCLEVWDAGGKKKIRGIYHHHVAPQFLRILYFGYSLYNYAFCACVFRHL